ncbi:MAG TPA: cytochrome c oxidase subunit II [Caulobacteraceae bacterium]|jgi:cytochrome c oxidase subunit 2
MQAFSKRIWRAAAGAGAAALAAAFGTAALAADLLGQPTPGAVGLQPGASELRHSAAFFHDGILMPVITAICLFVAGLLLYCVVRFNKRSNPTPARWSHNTPIEILWTTVPVLILMFFAVFSFRLLYAFHDMPRPDVTVKVTGYQWYWGYEYPDQKVPEFTAVLLPEDKAHAAGMPYRLAATEAMVVPVGKVVRVLVTGADVIHSWSIPAFGVKVDAVPGRVNQTWFRAERPGLYYGSCYELCGVDHAFMPIMLRAVSQPEFNAWVASKAGGAPAPTPTTLNAAANAAGAANTEAPAASAGAPPEPGNEVAATATGPASAPTAQAPRSAAGPARAPGGQGRAHDARQKTTAQ